MKIKLSEHFTYKKLLAFTLPSILMMIFTSVYSVVDGVFVSNFAGDIPFKAVNLIMPYITIVSTVGFMFGSGGTAIVASVWGEGDSKRANNYFSLFVYITFGLGVLLAVISFIFIRPIAALLGAEGEILENCVVYARVLFCSLPFSVLQYFFQSFFVAAEKPRVGLAVIIAAGVTNMVLDAVLVMLLPMQYKLFGAAIATAMSQVIGGGFPLIYFFRKNGSVFRLGRAHLDGRAIFKACTNGSSEFMSNVSMSLVGMLYNIQLLKYAGDDGIAAYGVMMYVSMIFSAIFIGYSMGVAPVISYNDGAGNDEEKRAVFKKSVVIIAISSAVMLIASELLASPLSMIFVSYDEKILNMTVHGFQIFAVSFLLMGTSIFASSFFTALNDGLTSALISFLRTLVFQLGAVLLLPLAFELDGIWLAVVVAEAMAIVLSVLFLVFKRKKYRY